MAAIGKVSIELEAKMAKLETDVGRAARLMEREMARMSSRVTGELAKMNQKAEQSGNILRKAFDLTVASQVVLGLRRIVDEYANLSARIRLASGANANFTASLQAVKKVSLDTYASLTATTGLVQKISQSLQNVGMSATTSFSQALKLTEVFNKSLVVSGAGTIQAEAAMLQFSQAIAKGKLDGDEFRSVMENNSRFMLLLADSMGVTFKELYRLREAGLLTNDMIMKVTENTGKLDKEFASFPVTLGRVIENFKTATTVFVGGMDTALGVSKTLASGIQTLANNIELLGAALGIAAVAQINKYIAGVITARIMSAQLAAALTQMGAATFVAANGFRALGVAMFAAVGGTVGLTIIGITAAIGGMAYAISTAVEQANHFSDKMAELKSVTDGALDIQLSIQFGDEVGSNAIQEQLDNVRAAANSLYPEMDALKNEIAALDGAAWKTADTFNRLREAQDELSKFQAVYNNLIRVAVGLSNDYAAAKERERQASVTAAAVADITKETVKEIEAMEKQRAALGASNVQMQEYARSVALRNAAAKKTTPLLKEEAEAIVAAFAPRIKEAKLLDDATALHNAKTKAQKDSIKIDKDHAKSVKEMGDALLQLNLRLMDLQAEGYGPLEKIELKAAAAMHDWAIEVEKAEAPLSILQAAMVAIAKVRDEDIKKTKEQMELEARRSDSIYQLEAAHEAELGAIQRSGRELAIWNALVDEANNLAMKVSELSPDVVAAIRAREGAHYDAAKAIRDEIAALERYQDSIIQSAHSASDAFGEMVGDIATGRKSITDGFEDFGKNLVDIVADTVAQMISEFFKLQIINPFLNSLFSGFGGNALPTAGGGGIFGGQGGIMGTIGRMFGGGGAAAAGGLLGLGGMFGGAGVAGAGANLGAIGLGMGPIMGTSGAGLAGLGGSIGSYSAAAASGGGLISGSGLGTAFAGVPIIGWIAAAMAANMSLFSQGWRPNGGTLELPNGQSITGGGSGAGRVLDRLADPLGIFGDRLASLLSGSAVFTRLFGRKAPELTGSSISMGLGGAGPSGSETYRTIERGGVFRSDRRRSRSYGLSDEAMESAQALFDELSAIVAASAERLRGEAPELIDAALRIVQEFDSKGKVKSTQYFVDAIGRTWEEATQEAAITRIGAENIIATIDSILGTTSDAIAETAAEAITGGMDAAGDRIGHAGATVFDDLVKSAQMAQGEASAIAERWRDDAEMLMEGATFLLLAAEDIRAGMGLLGEGSLTEITDLIEDLQHSGEGLSDTYARVALSTALFEEAIDLSGVTIDLAREEFVRFATEIAEAAGGIERAQSLWSSYFETFYSESERAALAASRARSSADREFGDIGLDVSAFTGEGGAAAFRAMFEDLLPTLSADAIVQWLEAANALGILIEATAALTGTVEEAAETTREAIANFMAGIDEEIASFGSNNQFATDIANLESEIALLIKEARGLGATEEEINRIRLLGQLRMNALLAEQEEIIAAQELASATLTGYLMELRAMASSSGITPLTQELIALRGEYQSHIDRVNELARASGRAGASQEELAVVTDWYAAQLDAVAQRLYASAASLIQRLYGTTQASSDGVGPTFAGGYSGGDIGGVTDAVEDRYAREMELLANLREYLESLGLSNLSPLTPAEQLQEAQSQYQEILARAMGGDLDALGQLQGAANTYLGQAQSYYGGVGAYGGIFDSVQSQIQALLDRGPLNDPIESPPTVVTGPGGGNVIVDPGEGFAQLSEIERMAIANELATVLRDLVALTGQSLIEVSQGLGLDLRALVRDLGVNLDDLTSETALQLANISRQLGVDLVELASGVGVSLGELSDAQSLMNDALEQTIDALPTEFRDHLRGFLEAIENATTEADANEAIADAEAAINLLPASIRDELAPFFGGVVSPGDQLLEEIIAQSRLLESGNDWLEVISGTLERIEYSLPPPDPGLPPPDPVIDAIVAASASSVLSSVQEAMVTGDSDDASKADTMSQIRAELASIKAAIMSAGANQVTATRDVERAVKIQPAGARRQ